MPYDATDFVVTEVPAPVRDPKSITDPRKRVAYLRDFLRELPPERFSMEREGEEKDAERGECGSPACIGGWARAIFRHRTWDIDVMGPILGLSVDETSSLFWPGISRTADGTRAYSATPAQAANVLDHYLATGLIDWSVA